MKTTEATMTPDEHEQRIITKCRELLVLAEKRTPGEWESSDNVCTANITDGYYFITCDSNRTSMVQDQKNAAFIASCAGRAEAGWLSTIAAIEGLHKMPPLDIRGRALAAIRAAWPVELLNPL